MTPRQKMPPTPPARVFQNVGEVDRAIEKIRHRIQDVERLASQPCSYRDASVDNIEHSIRDTIREEFGEGSPQFHRHGYFTINDGPVRAMGFHENSAQFHARGQRQFEASLPGAITRLQGLIQQLEEKRADFATTDASPLGDESDLDPLVRLPTRRGLERYWAAQTTDPDVPLCVVLFDIDRFKSVNDDHGGHPTGDEALVSVAGVAKACVCGKGTAFRFGGDEFILLLPNHTLEEGLAVAERFRRTVQASPRTARQLTLTVSVGVAQWPVHGADFESLNHAADKALYDAKNRGRNLVRFCGETEPTAASSRQPARRQPEPGGLTADEQRKILDDYFKTRIARCPRDQALLDVEDITAMGQSRNSLYVSCPLCGLAAELD